MGSVRRLNAHQKTSVLSGILKHVGFVALLCHFLSCLHIRNFPARLISRLDAGVQTRAVQPVMVKRVLSVKPRVPVVEHGAFPVKPL